MSKHKQSSTSTAVFGSSLVLLSSVFYGSYGVWARLMGHAFGPYMQSAVRSVIVVLIMLPIALYGKQQWQPFRWREDKWWFALSALASLLISAPQYYAYNRIGVGLTTLGIYGGYLASMFAFGKFLNGERYTPGKFTATCLALVGLLCTFMPATIHVAAFPLVAAIVSGVAMGLAMAVSQKICYSSSQTTIVAWGTGIIVSFPMALLLHEQVAPVHDLAAWGYLFAFVAVNVSASWLSIHGVKLIEAGVAGILGLMEVVWGIIFGALLFHEHLNVQILIGAVCIVGAAAIPYLGEYRKPRVKVVEEMPA